MNDVFSKLKYVTQWMANLQFNDCRNVDIVSDMSPYVSTQKPKYENCAHHH